jgi:hypothetical protein
MRVNIVKIYGQLYLIPAIKITHDKFLNGDYELIFTWLKWELIVKLTS